MYINASEYLQDIRATNISIHNKRRLLKQMEEVIAISGISYDNEHISSSPRKDKLEMDVIRRIEDRDRIKQSIEADIDFMIKRQDEAVKFINMMELEDQQEILMLRYIECKRWSEILDIRGCDDISSQYKLHKRALESLQEILNNHSMTIQ